MTDILKRWAFAGLAIGLTISCRLLSASWTLSEGGVSDTRSMKNWALRFRDLRWWMHFGLPLYMIHQFEEHGIDLYGRLYNFQTALCEAIVSLEYWWQRFDSGSLQAGRSRC